MFFHHHERMLREAMDTEKRCVATLVGAEVDGPVAEYLGSILNLQDVWSEAELNEVLAPYLDTEEDTGSDIESICQALAKILCPSDAPVDVIENQGSSARDGNSTFKKGDQCRVFSASDQCWHKASIIPIRVTPPNVRLVQLR
jgi:hypothetical protein